MLLKKTTYCLFFPVFIVSMFLVSCEIHFQNPFRMPNYGGEIAFRTITIDGERTGKEWDGVSSVIEDKTGDSLYSGAGGDIRTLYLAADSSFLYFMIETADKTTSTTGEFAYDVWIQNPDNNDDSGNIDLRVKYESSAWEAVAYRWDGSEWKNVSALDPNWGDANTYVEVKIGRDMVLQRDKLLFSAMLQRETLSKDPDSTNRINFTLP